MKNNFNRRVNKAHVSQVDRIISGAVTPTEEIMSTENGIVMFYENFLMPDKANRLLRFYSELDISVPSFRNYKNVLVHQPRACMWYEPVPYTQNLLCPITVLAKQDLDGLSRLEQIWP